MKIEINPSLKEFNTFGIHARADKMIIFNTDEEVRDFVLSGALERDPWLILGGGSNILFTRDVEGLVLKLDTQGIDILEQDDDYIYVKASAGLEWDVFVQACVDRGWGGLENLSLIPGMVGAGPIQNIGAYGVELKEHFDQLEAINLNNGDLRTFVKEDCMFGYRDSIFKGGLKGSYLILTVTFKLSKEPNYKLSYGDLRKEVYRLGEGETLQSVRQAVINIRKKKLPDPAETGNAGSFFKNPVINRDQFQMLIAKFPELPHYDTSGSMHKIAAGWLIEHCGWKGRRSGNAGVHGQQALVLVNHGGATGNEILELSKDIQASVEEKFGIRIEREINVY